MIATIPTALAAGGIFSDVPNGAWYADAVDYVYEHGIMNGTSATTFSPNTPMTRAMLVTVLHRAAGSPSAATGTAFSDVPSGAYYMGAVAWASANGIVTGYPQPECIHREGSSAKIRKGERADTGQRRRKSGAGRCTVCGQSKSKQKRKENQK